jgi:predicted O-methyltransferase YrrM
MRKLSMFRSRVTVHFLLWLIGLARAETQTTEAERECLVRYATGRRRVAEIGVWHGVTMRLLLAAMHPSGTYFAIDPYPVGRFGFSPQRVIARAGLGRAKQKTIRWLRTTGSLACVDPVVREAPIDFLFIDGDHSYEGLRGDWEGWSGLIGEDGVVALHDSRPTPTRPIHDAGSVRYTAGVIRMDPRFQVIAEVDSLTVLQRSKS